MKTNLENLNGASPLWLLYNSENSPQGAYVEIYRDGQIFYGIDYEIGNAIPMSVYHGRDLRIAIPNHLTTFGYHQLHDHIQQRLAIVIYGMDENWNGSNFVGTLTDDASEALEQLQHESYQGDWDGFDFDETTGEVES